MKLPEGFQVNASLNLCPSISISNRIGTKFSAAGLWIYYQWLRIANANKTTQFQIWAYILNFTGVLYKPEIGVFMLSEYERINVDYDAVSMENIHKLNQNTWIQQYSSHTWIQQYFIFSLQISVLGF